MKILMVHPHDIYSASEPWTIRITSIADELVDLGHEVKLVYFPLPKKERGKLRRDRITKYETIPFNRSKWKVFSNIRRLMLLGRWADIIHLQKCFAIASLPALFSSYLNGKPIHYDWDDWEYKIYLHDRPSRLYGYYLDMMEKAMPRLVDSISVSSDHLAKICRKQGIPSSRIVKANVCADLERFRPGIPTDRFASEFGIVKPAVLYLGQLHGAQYADMYLQAAKKVLESRKETRFIVVGGGVNLERLRSLADKLGIADKVTFTGFIEDSMVNQALSFADVAVACFEDTEQVRCKSPLKVAEYLASGKAIVATDVGEVRWMVGDAGVLTKPGDVDSLASAVIELIDNPALRGSLERKARQRAEKMLDWETVAKKLVALYSKDLADGKSR